MKYLFVLLFLLVGFISTIPYWTGWLAHHQLPLLTERLSENVPLKVSDDHYEQGWFHSSAKSVFTIDTPAFSPYLFTLQHTIDHGFLPAKAPKVHSILLSNLPLCTSSELLESYTSFQRTGEGTSTVEISPCTLVTENGRVQWQAAQGETHFVPDFSKVSGHFQNSHIQVNTGSTRVMMRDVMLQYLLERSVLAQFDVRMSALYDSDNAKIELNQIHLHNVVHEIGDYLTLVINSDSQQAFVDGNSFGPIQLTCSIQHVHKDTLQTIRTTLQTMYSRNLPFLQQNFLLTSIVMQQIPTLLEHKPKVTVPRWHFQTDAGQVTGMLQVEVVEVEAFDRRALLDPLQWTNLLVVQSELRLPYPALAHLARWTLEYRGYTATETAIEQRVQFWLTEGFFVPSSPKQSNYYQIQLQSQGGILQINDKRMRWQELLGR